MKPFWIGVLALLAGAVVLGSVYLSGRDGEKRTAMKEEHGAYEQATFTIFPDFIAAANASTDFVYPALRYSAIIYNAVEFEAFGIDIGNGRCKSCQVYV